jgi:hypothetical protein
MKHQVVLEEVMYLEKALEITITDIVDIVRLKYVLVIHLTGTLTFS